MRQSLGAPADPVRVTGIGYESLFKQFADGSENGMVLVGARRRVLDMNAAASEQLAFSGALPCPLRTVIRDLEVEFAVGDAFHDSKRVVYESFAPNPDRLLRYHMLPIRADSGETCLVVVTISDVTRLRHLETVRKDFVANVSHELRTPITSINLLVETLQSGGMEDPEIAHHFLRRIEVETLSMMRLVEELLELSRLESGRLSLRLAPTDLTALLRRVVDRLTPAAVDKTVHLRVEAQPGLPPVSGDQERLEQVFMNLVHNAIKFTPEGGDVILRAFRQGRGVQLEVVDTGVGMDPNEIARVLERFYKVDKGRNRSGGTGLGLAVSRHIVELHGSRLQIVSEPDRGTRIEFALPIADS